MSEQLGDAVLDLRADGAQLDRDMAKAERSAADRLSAAGARTAQTGKTLTRRVTAPIVGAAGAILTVGAGFDDQMSRVAAISGATGDDLDTLRDQAKELGSTTRFSAREAASGMEFLALAGFEVNEVTDAMPGMLNLASAANLDLASTADIVSDTMSAFNIEASEAGDAADIFAQQSSQSNTSVLQLGEAMKMAAPNANAAGMSLSETSAVLGVLADKGIKGSMAGTTVNAMLRDLIGNAEDGAVAIGDTAVSVFDAEGNMRDFGAIMRDVNDATDGLTDAQRESALRSVFQARSIRGVNVLMGEGIDTFDEYLAANDDSAGASTRMAEVMEDNLGGAFRELKSQAEGIIIQLSEQLAPIVRNDVVPAVKRAGEVASELIDRFQGLDDRTKKIVVAVIGLVAAAGPLLFVLGTVMKIFGTILKPISKTISAVSGLSKAFRGADDAPKWASRIAAASKKVGRGVSSAGKATARGAATAVKALGRWIAAGARWAAQQAVAAAKALKTMAVTTAKFVAHYAKMAARSLANAARVALSWVIAMGPIGWAIAAVVALVALIIANWSKVKRWTKAIWSWISDKVAGVWRSLTDRTRAAVDGIVSWIRNLRDRAIAFVSGLVSWLVDNHPIMILWRLAREWVPKVIDKVREIKDRIIGFFSGAKDWLLDAGKNIIQGLIDGVGSMVGAVKDKVESVVETVTRFLPWSPAKEGPLRTNPPEEGGRNIAEQLARGLDDGRLAIESTFASLLDVDMTADVGKVLDRIRPERPTSPDSARPIDMHVQAWSDRFSLAQIEDELALHGAG